MLLEKRCYDGRTHITKGSIVVWPDFLYIVTMYSKSDTNRSLTSMSPWETDWLLASLLPGSMLVYR